MKARAFLAFDIPCEVRNKLAKVIADFSVKERGVKWVKPENLHVTIRFFGSVEEDLLLGEISERIRAVAKGFGAVLLKCEGLGVFPNWKYPRVFWAGLTGETAKMINLCKTIESSISSYGLHEEKRDLRLHLTLGRARGQLKKTPLVELVEKLGPIVFGDVLIDRIILYKSVLTKEGPIYTSLKEFLLKNK